MEDCSNCLDAEIGQGSRHACMSIVHTELGREQAQLLNCHVTAQTEQKVLTSDARQQQASSLALDSSHAANRPHLVSNLANACRGKHQLAIQLRQSLHSCCITGDLCLEQPHLACSTYWLKTRRAQSCCKQVGRKSACSAVKPLHVCRTHAQQQTGWPCSSGKAAAPEMSSRRRLLL